MKNQTTKKLSAFIIAIMFSGLSQFACAQHCGNNSQCPPGYSCVGHHCKKNKTSGYRQGDLNKKNVNSDELNSENNTQETALSSCACSVPGYGCADWDIKCRNHCFKVCSHHAQISNDEGITANVISNSATVSFFIEHKENISLRVFDINGRLVKILASNVFEEGVHSFSWNTKDENVSAGVYALTLNAGADSETQKIIVMN